MNTKKCILTIAGSDSSGGAGIQADIKVISALGGYAASVITALTAQNTLGVQSIYEIEPSFVAQQLESVFSDLSISAVKIGMLHDEKIINAVASALKKFKPALIVLDPVMVSKNQCALLNLDAIDCLCNTLIPLATLITPNVLEAEMLLKTHIYSELDQQSAATKLVKQYGVNVLIKGGHMRGKNAVDVLVDVQLHYHCFSSPRIKTANTHGTGCSLSSAIATFLASGHPLKDAVSLAKKYITNAIRGGQTLAIGRGYGPVEHFI